MGFCHVTKSWTVGALKQCVHVLVVCVCSSVCAHTRNVKDRRFKIVLATGHFDPINNRVTLKHLAEVKLIFNAL